MGIKEGEYYEVFLSRIPGVDYKEKRECLVKVKEAFHLVKCEVIYDRIHAYKKGTTLYLLRSDFDEVNKKEELLFSTNEQAACLLKNEALE